MTQPPMLADILGQPASHLAVLQTQAGSGAPAQAEATRIVRECTGRVLLSGMGASFFALLPCVQALQAAGVHAVAVESSDLLYASGVRWRPDDCAILISRSGGSVEVLKLAESLRSDGVRLIGVTNVPGSPLTHVADVTLIVGSLPDELIAVQSYTGTVLALLLVASSVIHGNSTPLQLAAAEALPLLNDLIRNALDQSDQWHGVLAQSRPLYLLGRGGATATIHEGSLLMHETAKASAIAMASGQFRHGPVEVVDSRFCAVLVGSDARTRHLDWKLGLDLQRMGSRVLWIGPRLSGDALPSMVSWPDLVPEALLPLFDIVPLQVAALRAAEWRGIVAGEFRYASEVTADEASFPYFEAKTR